MNFKSFLFACSLVLLMGTGAFANNMLVQNVTTLGNDAVNRTIQVQFDISWDNSWRDAINYDAAWIFMKFKNASGVWQHVQLNQTGFVAGTGTANTVQVTADKVGSWLYRSGLGSGTFTSTGMQLQWNYGLAGLTSVTGLEVRVFAVEMVYVPEGEFNCAPTWSEYLNSPSPFNNPFIFNPGNGETELVFEAPGRNFPVINNRLSPILKFTPHTIVINNNNYVASRLNINLRIKGDAGIDANNDGVIENTSYPTGYNSFYCFKYELTEQQYADFLNTLSTAQSAAVGYLALTNPWGQSYDYSPSIVNTQGQFFSSFPNRACVGANEQRVLAFADWAGIRPMSFLEFNKVSYGSNQPILVYNSGYYYYSPNGVPDGYSGYSQDVGSGGSSNSNIATLRASLYGIVDLSYNVCEPVFSLSHLNFTVQNGDGNLLSSGLSDIEVWNNGPGYKLIHIDQSPYTYRNKGYRYVRSAE